MTKGTTLENLCGKPYGRDPSSSYAREIVREAHQVEGPRNEIPSVASPIGSGAHTRLGVQHKDPRRKPSANRPRKLPARPPCARVRASRARVNPFGIACECENRDVILVVKPSARQVTSFCERSRERIFPRLRRPVLDSSSVLRTPGSNLRRSAPPGKSDSREAAKALTRLALV